jgi:diguanylate cyclase
MADGRPADVEMALRGPDSYRLAQVALAEMQAAGVWPTPLNFELWIHAAADAEGPLSRELRALRSSGEAITEDKSEELAARYLPRGKLDEKIRDAGQHLDTQLEQVARAIVSAQKTNADYGRTLAGASRELAQEAPVEDVKRLVSDLAAATRRVHRENDTLEKRLRTSTEEVQRLRERLEDARRDAMTDALSGLPNRKAFDQGLAKACAEADATGAPLTLAVLDIDHFKRFNDTWGHQTGDQVIRFVASIIRRNGGAPRLPARYGGEEFALVLPGERAGRAQEVLDAVRTEISSRSLKRRSTDEDLGAVTVSAGVAQRRRGESLSSLVERADAALYESKRAGRNRVTSAEDMLAPVAAA